MRKKEGHMHGGERTPMYYCKECDCGHRYYSKIGKKHWDYRRKEKRIITR